MAGHPLRVAAVLGALALPMAYPALAANVWAPVGPTPELLPPGRPGGVQTPKGVRTGPPAVPRTGFYLIPSITAQELYTDNVRLAPPGLEQSDFVSEIDPTLRLIGNTRRLKLDFWYQMQNLIYADHSNLNKTNHLLQLGSTAELIKDHGFLDFTVHRRPQNISNTGRVAFDNVSASSNLSTTTTVSVSPYWKQRFGSFASAMARYTFDTVQSGSSSGFANSDRNMVNADVASGERFNRLKWELAYRRQDVSFNQAHARSSVLENEQGQLKYLITRHIALLGTLGYDNNSYSSAPGTAVSGIMWNVGAQWEPTHNTSIEGTVGERYFGTTYSFDLMHKTRLTDWVASYSEEPTTTRTTLLEQVLFPVVDAFGNPVFDPITGTPIELSGTIPTQTIQTVINKKFDTSFRVHLPHHTLQLGLTDIRRDYQVTGASETVVTTSARWTWLLGHRTHVNTTFRWIQNDLRIAGQDQYYLAQIALTRNLARTLVATAGYRYLQRNSNRTGGDYRENRVYITVSKTF